MLLWTRPDFDPVTRRAGSTLPALFPLRSSTQFGSILVVQIGESVTLRAKIGLRSIPLSLGLAALHFAGSPPGLDGQIIRQPAGEVRILAEHEVKQGGTVKLRGHVEVSSGSMTVHADEAEYNAFTGKVDARGHVYMDLGKTTPKITIQNSSPEDSPVAPAR